MRHSAQASLAIGCPFSQVHDQFTDSSQSTGDSDNATVEITASEDGYLVEQLTLDPEDASVIIDRQPLENTTHNPGLPYDAWHVNAKLQQLPDGWDTYLVAPSSPVRVFAGD